MRINQKDRKSSSDCEKWSMYLAIVAHWALKSAFVLMLLALGAIPGAAARQANSGNQTNSAAPAAAPDQPQQTQQEVPPGAKVIHDQAEYNAFQVAAHTQDPKERAEAMESFADHYPKSVAAADALEEAMGAWQAVGDPVKVLEVAKELLAVDATNVRALAIVVALDRVSAAQGDSSALDELCLDSSGGMRVLAIWQKPAGMTDADFALLHKQMDIIFNSGAGYCALQEHNYSQARDWYTRVLQLDSTNLENTYQLGIVDLELTPLDPNGFWYCARAMQLAKNSSNANSANGMESYCKSKYATYHGSEDGWSAIVAGAATQNDLPLGFAKSITQAPPSVPASPAASHK
jgi:tetratricopeptide (TPR) repeat protein